MAQINICLKHIFTVFNIFFMLAGGVAIALALWYQFFMDVRGYNLEGRSTQLFILYVVGCIAMMIALLGAYGAHKESKVALIMVSSDCHCMVLCFELKGIVEQTFRRFVPLDKSSEDVRNMAEVIQEKYHCCGLFSYKDWKNIPDSCVCSQEEEKEGKCQTVENNTFMLQRMSVYTKTCFPTIMDHIQFHYNIMLVVSFTLAVLALLGMILSSIMIHQLYYPNRHTIVVSMMPPKYKELHNTPAY
ncbi:tetraspanin-8-like [Pundamilia nyererei]|uniref:Tetraspanin n=1 Tax=Pundamilia nyererei TaxID=303518 RepID=A0A9Y3RKS8_9CICH|nr:PREDICTED: tetraspanin-8-like [Pundamilia nyererei]